MSGPLTLMETAVAPVVVIFVPPFRPIPPDTPNKGDEKASTVSRFS